MLKTQVLDYYDNSTTKISKALGGRPRSQTVNGWGEIVPEAAALRLERITDGALVYEAGLYRAQSSEVA
jgi:hypothetical protein